MAKQPEDLVLRILRDIQATLTEHTRLLDDHTRRFERLEKQLENLQKAVTYSLGQSTHTQFRQSQQESRIDELFEQLEKLLNPKEPA
jgi:hypothetical protein